MKEDKKQYAASLLPFRKRGNEWEFYLQKRGSEFRILPNMFAMFGGSIEAGETPEEACVREIEEELQYAPASMKYFSRYESGTAIIHVFIEEVADDFESRVTVCEGEYGMFKPVSVVRSAPDVALFTKLIVLEVVLYLDSV